MIKVILISIAFLSTNFKGSIINIPYNSFSVYSNHISAPPTNQDPICESWECVEKYKNQHHKIKGVFQKYTPIKSGKGANYMYWNYEIVLNDKTAIPVSNGNQKIDYKKYLNKKVMIDGMIFYGIVIGSAEGQNAKGYRIDPDNIRLD